MSETAEELARNTRDALLEEYRANVALWQHDDNLRQQRTGNLLTVTTVLLAGFSILVGSEPADGVIVGVGAVISLFGLAISVTWDRVQRRNAEYVRFRRYQLRSVEAQLPELSTFTNVGRAFEDLEQVQFRGTGETFTLHRSARGSSTRFEGLLPRALIAFWLLALLVTAVWGAVSLT